MKRLLFTHIDLDGYGCAVILNSVFKDIDIRHVNYGFMDEKQNRVLLQQYDEVYITDISVSKEQAIEISEMMHDPLCRLQKVILLDHHQSALDELGPLNFSWIQIRTDKCGTMLCYDRFSKFVSHLKYFATIVNDYDLWIHKYRESTNLQFLWSSMDKSEFVNRFVNAKYDESGQFKLTNYEIDLIYKQVEELDNSVDLCKSSMESYVDCDGNKFGYIKKTGRYLSLAVSRILNDNPDLTYVVAYNSYGNSLSFRSLHYPVNKIAESLGGGGHKLSAGSPCIQFMAIPDSVINRKLMKYDFITKKVEEVK